MLVERVEVKDVALPEAMKRSMSRQAEAERERRARVIAADGEFQASTQARRGRRDDVRRRRRALQLRLLQTVVEVAAEKNSTLVMPFPVELLRFFDQLGDAGRPPRRTAPTAERTAPPRLRWSAQPSRRNRAHSRDSAPRTSSARPDDRATVRGQTRRP